MIKEKLSELQKIAGDIIRPLPLHPNHITLLSLAIAAFGSYYVFQKDMLGVALIALSFAVDGLDGALARAKNQVTKFGAYLDGITDRIVEFFALLPLFFDAQLMLPVLITLFFGSCMTSFSKAYADHREIIDAKTAAKLHTLLPRAERVIGIFLVLILYLLGYPESVYIIWILAILSIISVIWLQFEAYSKCKE